MFWSLLAAPIVYPADLLQRMIGSVEERDSGVWQDRLHFGDFFCGLASILAAGAVALVAILAWTGSEKLELKYADAAYAAIQNRDFPRAVIACQRLAELQPADRKYRYFLALAHAGVGETERAVGLMQTLAPADELGYPQAQLWIVERQLGQLSPQDADALRDVESRLIRLRSQPEVGPAATLLLVRLYFLTGRAAFVLNEPSLRAAAEGEPELHLSLLQASVGRISPTSLRQSAQKLSDHFGGKLKTTPTDLASRRSAIGAEILVGDFAATTQLLREGLTLHPNDEDLQRLWGAAAVAQAQAAQFAPTSPELRKRLAQDAVQALELRPQSSSDYVLQSAQMLRLAGDFGEAERRYRQVLDKAPAARLELAEMLAANGREAEAVAEFTLLLTECQALPAAKRELPENVLLTGAALVGLKKWDEAEQLLAPVVGPIPQAKLLLLQSYLGEADAADNKPAERLAALQAALKIEPFFQPALQRLLKPLGDAKTETAARNMVIDLAAGGDAPASAYLLLGTDALLHDDPKTAQKYLDLALRLAPQSPIILNNLAWSLSFGTPEELNRALVLVEAADKESPGNPQIQDTHGRILTKLGRWKDALVQFQACAKTYDRRADFHEVMSEVYAQLQLPALSKRHQERAEAMKTLEIERHVLSQPGAKLPAPVAPQEPATPNVGP